MKMTGLNHITINVTDLEASRKFYQKILGLKENGFIDMGDHTLTYFELPRSTRLELIDYETKAKQKEYKETDIGTYRHFCLETDDLKELYRICRENGVFVRKEPSYVEKLSCATMLIVDPNGVEIEIIEK
ncbi:MAG: VOC family protein [Lachnospiraceae bacterium]|nr:VOC family protein [Lachnospiraceae bacterium]